jgi:hypothetical protein
MMSERSSPASSSGRRLTPGMGETATALHLSVAGGVARDNEAYLVADEPATTPFTVNQRDELRELDVASSLNGEGTHQTTYLAEPLTSSSEASPARTSPSPESERDSPVAVPDSTGRSSESFQGALFGADHGSSSLRTSPASYLLAHVVDAESAAAFYDGISNEVVLELRRLTAPTSTSSAPETPSSGAKRARPRGRSVSGTPEQTSRWSAPRWRTSGTASATEYSTADTSEWPRDGAESSCSLSSILESEVDRRYYLSPRAALGILSRAGRRGRELPTHLLTALEAVVAEDPELESAYRAGKLLDLS